LIDLVEMIERVIEHAAQRLARRVRVRRDRRVIDLLPLARVGGLGEAIEELIRHR
jgi:hypothetical protein